MGKIDKEKLLREIHCKGTGNFNGSGCCNGCNNYNDDHNTTGECLNSIIKNFPEDPEIDFDALYKEYLGSVQFGSIPTAWQFRDFLKAKHLTAPKPVEIPVKKTWSLKKHVEEIFHDFGNKPYPLTLDPPENLKKYYNQHEEPDYSKIPNGSIVELKHGFIRWFLYPLNDKLFMKMDSESCKTEEELSNIIRIVELANEKV